MCLWMSVLISQLFLYDQEQRYNGSFSLDLNRMPDQYPQRVMQLNRQQNLFMLLVTKNNIFDFSYVTFECWNKHAHAFTFCKMKLYN